MELLTAYTASGAPVKTAPRDALLREIQQHSLREGDAPWSVRVVQLILFNSAGEIYVVRRGDKPENPNRLDKTVGGHVTAGETFSSALCREVQEEIGVDVVLCDHIGFRTALREVDTTRLAVVRPVDYHPWMRSVRATNSGPSWIKRHNVVFYAGRYDGPVEFVDGEAIGMQLVSPAKLLSNIDANSSLYTDDLRVLLERYLTFYRNE
jgi:8-oxo-dGTP pyrophosphatase MutT (NUDIX family)